MTDTVDLTLEEADALARDVLEAWGLAPDHAAAVAATMVAGERDGCTSHGLYRLLVAAASVEKGVVTPDAEPVVSEPAPALVRVDGKGGFAQLPFARGVPLLVEKARTMGIAAMGIYALLKDLKLTSPRADSTGRPWARDAHPLVLVTISRPLLPLALLVSVYIFLRGHNLPGGGFVAGLITSVALLLQYVASGVTWVHKRIPGDYHPLVALGVLLAGLTGVGSWVFGAPFLTSTFTHVHLPLIGDFELASAMLFDTGVFLTVVGATLLILANLGKLSLLDDKKETT